jgi:uncharacterized protein (DUF433 family)
MNTYHMIETNPEVMLGKPVIKGTRIPVDLIVRKLGEGASFEDLLDGYPNLSRDAIQAALIYAADMIHNETTIFLKTGALINDVTLQDGFPVNQIGQV